MAGGWVDQLKRLRWQDEILNTAISGNTVGFVNNGNPALNTLQQIERYLSESDPDRDRLDQIVILLGTNDCKAVVAGRQAEVSQHYQALLDKIAHYYAGKSQPRLIIVSPHNEQIRNAERMLGGLDLPTFIEKRDLGTDYRAGVLHRVGAASEPVDVMLAASPVEGERRHVLLSRHALPDMRHVEISIRRMGQVKTVSGSVEQGHEGRRAEDKLDGDRLHVSFFHPAGG